MGTLNSIRTPACIRWSSACLLSSAVACSQGSEQLFSWPEESISHHSDTTEGDDHIPSFIPSQSGEEEGPGDTETDPEWPEEDSSTSDDDSFDVSSESSSSSSSTSDSSDDVESTSGTENICEPELCFEFNPDHEIGETAWTHRQYIFPFKLERPLTKVARVELVEGQYDGVTTLKLRASKSGGDGAVLAQVTWNGDPSNSADWRGTNFDAPVEVKGGDWLWVHVFREGKALASSGKRGMSVPVWYRDSDDGRWSKQLIAVKLRVYCCKDE